MKKYIFYTLISLSLPFFFDSCSEDFLDKTKIGEETNVTFYASEENCEMAVTAAYAVLITRHGFSRNYWAFGDVASDDSEAAGQKDATDQPACQNIDKLNIVAGNEYLFQFYGDMYQGIYRCNVAIENIPNGLFKESKKNQLIAEARFLRAFFHHHLNVVFGGVRIIDHVLIPDEYAAPRQTVAEVLHFIQDEMAAAATVLQATYSAADEGRASKGAALGYQLKALVFESSYAQLAAGGNDPSNYFKGCTEKWDEAVNVFNQIEALGVHQLEPHFADLWPVSGERSSEHMFSGHSVSLKEGAGIEDINRTILGGVHCVYQACRSYYEPGDTVPKYSNRAGLYGLNAPTYDLFNAYEAGDPRQDISFITEGELIPVIHGGETMMLPAGPSSASPTNMNNAKYDPLPSEWINPIKHYGPRDLKFLRYADVLTLAAEAAFHADNSDLALNLINRIRIRARNSGTSGVPADLTAIDLDAIRHERRVELALEAHRYFDIVRWGIAGDKLTGTVRATSDKWNLNEPPLEWIPGKHEFFPIPESEIAINQGEMAQNPGY